MKPFWKYMLLTVCVLGICSFPAFASDIHVTVDGKPVSFTDAHTMLPLRAVGEALGLEYLQ